MTIWLFELKIRHSQFHICAKNIYPSALKLLSGIHSATVVITPPLPISYIIAAPDSSKVPRGKYFATDPRTFP